jgi:hypothetical protein
MAEAYWDLEWELQQQGFNYCYDKRLYDRLEHGPAEQVRLHLCADLAYQEKLIRFVENHDEPRAAATFGYQKARAVAVTFATVPGAKLFHEGQFEGWRVRLPVFLRRRPEEVSDRGLQVFYKSLLHTIRSADFREGKWTLCERIGLPDNGTYLNIVAWCWEKAADRHLIVVNLSETRSQARVKLPWTNLAGRSWRLTDPLQAKVFERAGDELREAGAILQLWDTTTGQPCGPPAKARVLHTALEFSPDGRHVLTLRPDSTGRLPVTAQLWRLPHGDVPFDEMQRRTWQAIGARLDAAGNLENIPDQEWSRLHE